MEILPLLFGPVEGGPAPLHPRDCGTVTFRLSEPGAKIQKKKGRPLLHCQGPPLQVGSWLFAEYKIDRERE